MSAGKVDVLLEMEGLIRLSYESGADEGPKGNAEAYKTWQKATKARDAITKLFKEIEAIADLLALDAIASDYAAKKLRNALAKVQP